jgi:hypothetical protein
MIEPKVRFFNAGKAREVYEMGDYVLKVQIPHTKKPNKQNENEYLCWQKVKNTPIAYLFAPCFWLSDCKTYMIQSKAKPYTLNKSPPKLPKGFLDAKKPSNWGLINGNPVIVDYGKCENFLMSNGRVKQ